MFDMDAFPPSFAALCWPPAGAPALGPASALRGEFYSTTLAPAPPSHPGKTLKAPASLISYIRLLTHRNIGASVGFDAACRTSARRSGSRNRLIHRGFS
jgi:hypothetical protein